MWKKDEQETDGESQRTDARKEAPPAADRSQAGRDVEGAIIGHSIRIQGEVTGDEDLVIQGHVDGSVELDQHAVTVGPDGEVKADIRARVITVEGRVDGDLSAEEQVVVRSSARVEGDISAPRVVLEDGAYFRGGVDMEEASRPNRRGDGSNTADGKKTSGRDLAATVSRDGNEKKEAMEEKEASGDQAKDTADSTAEVAQ